MEELNYEKILAEMNISIIDDWDEEHLKKFLCVADKKGIYEEKEEKPIDKMTITELRKECKKIIKQCRISTQENE